MPVPEAVSTSVLTAQTSALVNEIRLRQQPQENETTYVNLAAPQVNRAQKPQQSHVDQSPPSLPPAEAKPNIPRGGVPMPGMGMPGNNSVVGSSLADQLKSRLEERRKSREGEQPFLPDSIAADIQHAVQVANENGERIKVAIFPFYCVRN